MNLHALEEQVRPVDLNQPHHMVDLPVKIHVGTFEVLAECHVCYLQSLQRKRRTRVRYLMSNL